MTVPTVREAVDLRDGRPPLTILRPADSEALIDEEAFARQDEYLPYWAELWPSATALARLLAALPPPELRGRRVLELGCGLALPALAAARAGAHVVATDWSADAITAAQANAAANDLPITAVVADWRDAPALAAHGPFDLVLAADVLYEARHVPALLDLLGALRVPRILIADPSRATAEPFLEAIAASYAHTTSTDAENPRVRVHDLRAR